MTIESISPAKPRPPCSSCGGSGQVSFFRGVSRFVMDWEDCPDCLGTGQAQSTSPEPGHDQDDPATSTQPKE